MRDSYPFLHLSRRLCIPYADVLLFADWVEGLGTTISHQEAAIRIDKDHKARKDIIDAVNAEFKRRELVVQGLAEQKS